MSLRTFCYAPPSDYRLETLTGRLGEGVRYAKEPARRLRRSCLDSFDWRIYAAGGQLEEELADEGSRLIWRDRGSQSLLGSAAVRGSERFIWDLPPGRLREGLTPILEMRAVLPVVTFGERQQVLRVLNRDDKTVLRLVWTERRVLEDGGRVALRERQLELRPVRGYERALRAVRRLVEADLGAPVEAKLALERALAACGKTPLDYSSKLELSLAPQERTDVALKAILLRLLDTMQVNEAGLLGEVDSEFLHDFRVAVRRTRSALGQVRGVLPEKTWARFREAFAWLGTITSPARDMDVYLLDFDAYKARLPAPMRAHLEPLRDFLRAHQASEYRALARDLRSARYRRMARDWRRFLQRPVAVRPAAPNAVRPVKVVADERIWRMYRRVMKEGSAITEDSPAEDLHELRKTCKKLRYLMEFFASLYPGEEIRRPIQTLKRFQENLGAFQDLYVQEASLGRFEEQMAEEGNLSRETRAAMDHLVEAIDARKQAVRDEFAGRFERFSAPRNRRRFRALFRHRRGSRT